MELPFALRRAIEALTADYSPKQLAECVQALTRRYTDESGAGRRLLTKDADLRRTENEKIFVEEKPPVRQSDMEIWLWELENVAENGSREQVFQALHRLVPTFRDPGEVNAAAIRAAEEQRRTEPAAVVR